MEKENRINIEDLPQAERAVTQTEAKEVRGGVVMEDLLVASYQTGGSGHSDGPSRPVKGGDDILIGGPTSTRP